MNVNIPFIDVCLYFFTLKLSRFYSTRVKIRFENCKLLVKIITITLKTSSLIRENESWSYSQLRA